MSHKRFQNTGSTMPHMLLPSTRAAPCLTTSSTMPRISSTWWRMRCHTSLADLVGGRVRRLQGPVAVHRTELAPDVELAPLPGALRQDAVQALRATFISLGRNLQAVQTRQDIFSFLGAQPQYWDLPVWPEAPAAAHTMASSLQGTRFSNAPCAVDTGSQAALALLWKSLLHASKHTRLSTTGHVYKYTITLPGRLYVQPPKLRKGWRGSKDPLVVLNSPALLNSASLPENRLAGPRNACRVLRRRLISLQTVTTW